ncbi:MAG: hypothetical protein ABF966_09095 [Bifidobacterium psychraerophilum]|uniref:trypsin-like serine peptidase n=1 Tax=Bifidobacterium psychraerophilum TaxID=218140 RepID=UPI0039E7CABC
MKNSVSKLSVSLVLGLVTLTGVGIAPTAQAASSETAGQDSTTDSNVSHQIASKNMDQVEKVWTDAAIKHALAHPLDAEADSSSVAGSSREAQQPSSGALQQGQRGVLSNPVAPVPDGPTARSLNPTNPGKTFGRLLFFGPGGTYSCSASLVNSSSKNLLLTAAHCLKPGKNGDWYTDFVYYSEWKKGQAPIGHIWPGYTAHVKDSWLDVDVKEDSATHTASIPQQAIRYDYGFVVIAAPGLNLRPVNTLGGNGMSYNEPYDFNATILGYPATASDEAANNPFVCKTKTNAYVLAPLYNTVEAPNCDGQSADGMSGGPWLTDPDSGMKGWAHSVTSGSGNGSKKNSLLGPYFDDNTKELFNYANDKGKDPVK